MLLEKTKKKLKNLSYNLNGVLCEQGVSNSIEIVTFPHDTFTNIDIIDPNSIIYARVDCHERNFPIKLKVQCFTEDYGKKTMQPVPEDLKIYISMNMQEPNSKQCEKMAEFPGPTCIIFPCSNREEKKYPNTVYFGFETMKKGCCLEINVQFEKSDAEKAAERKLMLEKFKTE